MNTIQPKVTPRGFTLVELMVALAIAAILITLTMPSFQSSIEKNRISSINDKLVFTLQFARSEAVVRGKSITVCRSDDQASCSGSWDDGWIVFVDEDADRTIDGDDTLLRVSEAVPVNYDVALDSSPTTSFQFDKNGFAPEDGTFHVCGPSDEDGDARGLLIRASGSMRQAVDTNSDGVREDHNGAEMSC